MLTATDAVNVIAACQSPAEALDIINRGGIDLVVMDIDMPGLSGVDAARQITVEPKPLLVFATAHPEYAVDAFGIDAIDYILKPVAPDRIQHAVEKAERLHGLIQRARGEEAVRPSSNRGEVEGPDMLHLRDGNRMYAVPLAHIVRIEAGGDYSLIHAGGAEIVVRRTLTSLQNDLPSPPFVRVHRSYIIASTHVREVRRLAKGECEIRLDDGSLVRSSRKYRDDVAALFGPGAG